MWIWYLNLYGGGCLLCRRNRMLRYVVLYPGESVWMVPGAVDPNE